MARQKKGPSCGTCKHIGTPTDGKGAALRWALRKLIDARSVEYWRANDIRYGGVELEEIKERGRLLEPEDGIRPSKGWAVVHERKIDVRTVSSTRKTTIMKWLCVTCHELVTGHTTDKCIENMWRFHSAECEATVVEVDMEIRRIAAKRFNAELA